MLSERNPVFDHGYSSWTDMYNERQLLSLAKLLRSIDEIEDPNAREYLLLAFSDFQRTNSMMCSYQPSRNHSNHIFKTNSFDPPNQPSEGNVWGAKYGMGTFESAWEMVMSGVEYANAPTDRHMVDDSMEETPPFSQPIGQNATVHQGDMRLIGDEDRYDAVITDPPYYDNIIYSELADYFYVWLKLLLEDEYEGFDEQSTPRAESIVANPYLGKGSEEFESELHEAFTAIRTAIKEDGVLTFTYHHSDSESWGELLTSLCDADFEVTATYPISSDIHKFIGGEAVEFDIIIVARPAGDREPVSWRNLRRRIIQTTKQTHARLTENRDLNRGDIGVIEMGRAFSEYSKHHGNVRRGDGIMDAKDVVDEIYGILQEASDVGELDVYIDLLSTASPSYSDLNMLSQGTSADPDRMRDMHLYEIEDGDFTLLNWTDDDRIAYIEARVNGDDAEHLTALDKAHYLRYKFERGQSTENYLNKWGISDGLRDMCESLADATGDETYRRLLGGDSSLTEYGA